MTTATAVPPKRCRRWLQFSLRSLMVLVLIVSMPLAWLALRMKQAREQRAVVEEIRGLGGVAMYCHLLEPLDDGHERCPTWLRDALGDDFFETINYVELNSPRVTDQKLALMRALPELRALHLRGSQVTDAGLTDLASLRWLSHLSADGTAITDRGVEHLRRLPNLKSLDLSATKITDAGLSHLRGLARLRRVDLEDTVVTDAGVAALKEALPELSVFR